MFGEMRSAINCPKTSDILEHVYAMPAAEQDTAMEAIRDVERRAMTSQTPQPGLLTLITFLETHNLPMGICTRNFDTPVTHLLEKFLAGSKFHPIVTRDFRPPKPHPAGILHICESWGVSAEGVLMVGDSVDDMTAGYRAGATTVLLVNDVNRHLVEHDHTDIVIERLDELIPILEKGLEGRKLEGRGMVGRKAEELKKL